MALIVGRLFRNVARRFQGLVLVPAVRRFTASFVCRLLESESTRNRCKVR